MSLTVQQSNGFEYVEEGDGPPILFLHGLFGALSNFKDNFDPFTKDYKVVLPLLPLYTLEMEESTVTGMVDHVERFIEHMGYEQITLLGNSLGGHVALLYTLRHPEKVKALVLTGSSGLYESSLGDTFPKRGDFNFIKSKTEDTFYDPSTATAELLDEVFEIVNNRDKIIRIISIAKSAIRHNLGENLGEITAPTLLIWGKEDTVTPAFVGAEFHKLIPNSRLEYIDKCGHAAMMEQPEAFNNIFRDFLNSI